MAIAYCARPASSGTLGHVVGGSMVVAIGTSMAYGALPLLVMHAVPITDTTAATGLNTLLRSVGTSASSATLGALTAASALGTDGPVAMFWLAALASFLAAGLTVPLLLGPRRRVLRVRRAQRTSARG